MFSIILIIVIAVMTLSLFLRWRSPTLDFSDKGNVAVMLVIYAACIVTYLHINGLTPTL